MDTWRGKTALYKPLKHFALHDHGSSQRSTITRLDALSAPIRTKHEFRYYGGSSHGRCFIMHGYHNSDISKEQSLRREEIPWATGGMRLAADPRRFNEFILICSHIRSRYGKFLLTALKAPRFDLEMIGGNAEVSSKRRQMIATCSANFPSPSSTPMPLAASLSWLLELCSPISHSRQHDLAASNVFMPAHLQFTASRYMKHSGVIIWKLCRLTRLLTKTRLQVRSWDLRMNGDSDTQADITARDSVRTYEEDRLFSPSRVIPSLTEKHM